MYRFKLWFYLDRCLRVVLLDHTVVLIILFGGVQPDPAWGGDSRKTESEHATRSVMGQAGEGGTGGGTGGTVRAEAWSWGRCSGPRGPREAVVSILHTVGSHGRWAGGLLGRWMTG